MANTSLDLCGKIDKIAVSALLQINQIASSMNIPFFVVGAAARDILLEVHYGIGSKRATVDIDVAVCIDDWDENSVRRQKDASDLVFIIRNYLDAGKLERLFEEA